MERKFFNRIAAIFLASFICTQSAFAKDMINIDSMTDINIGQTITTITVCDAETIEGNEITVPISISNNAGLVGLTLSVEYDSNVLTLTEIVRGEALSSLAFTKPGDIAVNPFGLLWDGVEADASNGNLVLLEFEITDGEQYIEGLIDVTVADACDNDMEDVETVVNKSSLPSDLEMGNIINDEPTSTNSSTSTQINQTSNLSVISNIKLNGVSVGENGMRIIDDAYLSCNFSVSNISSDDKVVAILATYTSEGDLHNVQIYEIGATQASSHSIEYQFDVEKDHSGKLMFWNIKKNLMPIRASIDFTQNSGINAYYYDADNRLLQIDKANGKSLYFTYDNMGNLLSKTISGGEEDA